MNLIHPLILSALNPETPSCTRIKLLLCLSKSNLILIGLDRPDQMVYGNWPATILLKRHWAENNPELGLIMLFLGSNIAPSLLRSSAQKLLANPRP